MQVCHNPVRHDHLTETSQASASSSKVANLESHATVIPLRANETEGPDPRGPSGRWGLWAVPFRPGVIPSRAPKISVCTFSAGTPHVESPSRIFCKNDGGPHK